jgi:DNA-binding CsgD family transcriptional regulator
VRIEFSAPVTTVEHSLIDAQAIQQSIELMYDAALVGDGWLPVLDSLSRAGGSRGVVLMHNHNRKLVSAIANREIQEPVATYLAGKAPPNSRQTKLSYSHDAEDGFRIDQDDYRAEDINHDHFYQEFLRPIGLFWHANARLRLDGSDEVAVSFKRELRRGAYEESDKAVLDHILPHMRAAARFAGCVFEAETRGWVKALQRRSRPIIEFNELGHVRRLHGALDETNGPLLVRRMKLVTIRTEDQVALDKAIQVATRRPHKPTSVLLHDLALNPYILQIIPSAGRARDVFISTIAMGMLIGRPKRILLSVDQEVAISLFRLTAHEARVASLVCDAHSTVEMARTLGVTIDTIRFHLKSIYEKTSVRSRSELVSLFAMLNA